jgi:hypothetical protein
MAPYAAQRTALQKNGDPDAGAVVYRIGLNIEDQTLFQILEV